MPTYRIHGNSEEDGRPVSLDVDAPDEGKAALIAERKKVRVGRIDGPSKPVRPPIKPTLLQRAEAFVQNLDEPRAGRKRLGPTIDRLVDGEVISVSASKATIADVIYVRKGRAFLRVEPAKQFWTIVWAIVVAAIILFVLALILMLVLSTLGAAAALFGL